MSRRKSFPAAALFLACAAPAWGLSPEDKCEADKNKLAGKYALCRQNAEAKAIKKGSAPDYSKCDEKLIDKWEKAEAKAIAKGTSCIDAVTDTAMQSFVTSHSDTVAAALDGGLLPECGDGTINVPGEHCDGSDLGGDDGNIVDNGAWIVSLSGASWGGGNKQNNTYARAVRGG